MHDLGPQYPGDDEFTARMRLHQSWWRAERLDVPCGEGPRRGGNPYGNYLTPSDGDRGLNFLTGEIREVVAEREAGPGGVERYRNRHNLLSSQPMCFNLFGPLKARPDLARTLIDPLVPEAVASVEDLRIEYAPKPKSDYLDDATAFDAFVEYVSAGGERAFVGIECKLTEPFSQKAYTRASKSAYEDLTSALDGPFRPDVGSKVEDLRWCQLWRNHLLVEAIRKRPTPPHGTIGHLAIVRHPGDDSCAEAVAGYRELLNVPPSILDWPLDEVVATWRPLLDASDAEWLTDFEDRYLRLELSDHLAH